MKECENFGDGGVTFCWLDLSESVRDVLARGEMRKERGRLEEVAKTAILWPDVSVQCGIEERLVCDGDAAFFGDDEARDAIEQRRFSGAGRAEQNGDARRDGEIDVEMKCAARESSANT